MARRSIASRPRLGSVLLASALFAGPVVMQASLVDPARAQVGPGGIQLNADVQYGVADGQPLLMDVHLPSGGGTSRPALELIHGGGFVGGDKADMRGVARYFASNGYVCFSIDYRFAPNYPYPAAVNDARAAVEFVRTNAPEFGVDASRIGALGTSAGGTIAASIGAGSGALTGESRVVAVASWSGALDMVKVIEERPKSTRRQLSAYALGTNTGDPAASPAKLERASPITYLTRDDPPMFIANAKDELMPLDQAEDFVAKLKNLGIDYQLLTPALGHGLEYAAEAEPPTLAFLNRHLRGASTSPPTAAPVPSGPPAVAAPSGRRSNTTLLIAVIGGGLLLVGGLVVGPLISRRRRQRSASRY